MREMAERASGFLSRPTWMGMPDLGPAVRSCDLPLGGCVDAKRKDWIDDLGRREQCECGLWASRRKMSRTLAVRAMTQVGRGL